MNRRQLIKTSASIGFALPLHSLFANRLKLVAIDTPLLSPVEDETTGLPLLKLAKGFHYRTFGWTGDPMTNGEPTPDRHDGMAVVSGGSDDETILLRNHERWFGSLIHAEGESIYDRSTLDVEADEVTSSEAGGGVTAIRLKAGNYVETMPSIGGTMVNCAGGPTPWNTWLTCEEIVYRRSQQASANEEATRDHGYVFETMPPHLGNSPGTPIIDMGLMRHEAAAIDPATGYVYLTEDNGPTSGFYRYIPNDLAQSPGALLKGGKLFMLKAKLPMSNSANLTKAPTGLVFKTSWAPIENPDADPQQLVSPATGLPPVFGAGKSGPYMQGEAQGGAQFARGEGCWYHDGGIYWVDTAGGAAGTGTVWKYDPAEETLEAIFVSASEQMADAIDNITLNPVNGAIVLCEDGGGINSSDGQLATGSRLLQLEDANVRVIAENNIQLSTAIADKPAIAPSDYRGSEWAGATFSADGKTLYANIQTPGVTFAIEGPWLA